MPYLDRIISELDSLIASSSLTDQRFQPRLMAGIVQQIPVKGIADPSKLIFIPAKMNGLNDPTQIVPDDAYNLITYHRVISNNYSAEVALRSFGDDFEYQKCISDIIMIVISFNDKLKGLTQEQLEAVMVSAIPTGFSNEFVENLQMSSIFIQPTTSTFDSVAIYRQEYNGEMHFIRPEMSLFQIRYKIEASYKKGCFKICDDC